MAKKVARKKATATEKRPAKKKHHARKRELIDTGRDKRYVRRDDEGKFDDVVEQSRSLSQDRKRHAKKKVKPGFGDKGDQAPRKRAQKKS